MGSQSGINVGDTKKEPMHGPRAFIDLKRMISLSDGVFSIALTLLALELIIPPLGSTDLAIALEGMIPRLVTFVVSFLVIGSQWDVHQRTFLHVERADGTLVWLNLLALLFVVLLPASAAILGSFPLKSLALSSFALNSGMLGLVCWVMWQHASHNGKLLDKAADPKLIRMVSRLWLLNPIVFGATIPLSYANVYVTYVVWIMLPVISYTSIGRYLRRGGMGP
jgi:uncharacterized membrane protein